MDQDITTFLDICGLCQPASCDDEQLYFLDCLNIPTNVSNPRSLPPAPPRHAFGHHRRTYQTPTPHVESTSSSTEEFEEENMLLQHIVVKRGKKQRTSSGRVPVTLKKKAYNLEPAVIASALSPCCANKCNEQFNYTDLSMVRTEFWNLTRPKQLDWVTRQLAFHGCPSTLTGKFTFKYVFHGKECCAKFLEQALPISHGRLSMARNKVLTMQMEDSTSADSPSNCPKSDSAESYIRDYARKHAGAMPDSDDVQLPAGKTREAVYCDYLIDMFQTDEEVQTQAASLSTWYKTWRSRCFHVKAPKWQKFSKCSTCSNIKVLRDFTDASKQGKPLQFLIS